MRPRCSILTGGFNFSGCGDCTSCPPFKPAEMSNSEPSAIVLQAIPCMGGLYALRFLHLFVTGGVYFHPVDAVLLSVDMMMPNGKVPSVLIRFMCSKCAIYIYTTSQSTLWSWKRP